MTTRVPADTAEAAVGAGRCYLALAMLKIHDGCIGRLTIHGTGPSDAATVEQQRREVPVVDPEPRGAVR